MRLPMLATLAVAALSTACQPAATEFDPNDPEAIAAIEAIVQDMMVGASDVDADRVLAAADDDFTFITADVLIGGSDYIKETFQNTYDGLERQDAELLDLNVRLIAPDVAIVAGISEGTYTDMAGWTSEPVGMGYTLVFVRADGAWKMRHAHQSIAH